MAGVEVRTTVSVIRITLSLQEARAILDFFGSLDPALAPPAVRELSRKFRAAVQDETFTTEVQ